MKEKIKASDKPEKINAKKEQCEQLYSLEQWLPNAAKRAGRRAFATHPSTFSHSSTGIGDKNRKNHTHVTPVICQAEASVDGFLRTGNVVGELDSLGNATDLDVDKFLSLTLADGRSLFDHLEQNTDQARSEMTIKAQPYDQLRMGFLAMARGAAKDMVTSPKIKQVYFPVADGRYHLLSLLTPSGLMFAMKKRLDDLRFSDEVKAIKEKRKNGEYSQQGFRDIPGLTTLGYCVSNAQNISELNSRNGGKTHLLLSAPPVLKKRDVKLPNKNFFTQSFSCFKCQDIFHNLHKLYLSDCNNHRVREARDEFYQAIIDRMMIRMWQVRAIAGEQYYPESSQLAYEQKVWLLDGEYKRLRESQNDWLDRIIKAIARYIHEGYATVLDKKAKMMGDPELLHITRIVEQNREALR